MHGLDAAAWQVGLDKAQLWPRTARGGHRRIGAVGFGTYLEAVAVEGRANAGARRMVVVSQ